MPLAICVFCSSSDHVDGAYRAAAIELGQLIGQRGHTLVYGGGSIGLMGQLARSVHQHGGKIIGVIPKLMVDHELCYHESDELIVTETIRQRKQIMDDRSDAFVALPGGFGTLEEMIEALTHRQLHYHDKPIVLINTNRFYEPLLVVFEQFYDEAFAKRKHRNSYDVAATPREAVQCVEK